MDKHYIRDFHGRIIGSIETNGTKQIARDFYLKILGTYDSRDDLTRDFSGRILARGNSLAGLIFQKK